MKRMTFVGLDGFCRPVYKDQEENFWKDINQGDGFPNFYSTDEFEGEPGFPLKDSWECAL